jgi:hypothetical protein
MIELPFAHRRTNRQPGALAAMALSLTLLPVTSLHATPSNQRAGIFDIRRYGAKGNSQVAIEGSIVAGSKILKCADCSLSAIDKGRKIFVYGASNAQDALSLATTVEDVTDAGTATLADAATQTVSHSLVQILGANDTNAVLLARRAACRAGATGTASVSLTFAAGVYAIDKPIEPCSNLRITGGGTILQTKLVEGEAAGQGSSVIVFPPSPTGRWCSGGSMTLGSNVLKYGEQGDRPCNFSKTDAGSRVVVQYAGLKYLPLYASISKYVSPTEVLLDQPAATTVPVTDSGFDKVGTFVQIGTTPITNVEIDHLTLMNVSAAYPKHATLGVGIVAFGADPTSIKQNVRVNNLRIVTASVNCLGGNNGFLDQFWFENNTLVGCADAAMYVAGWNSRGLVSNNTIENIDFPGLPPATIGRVLHTGILVKNASNVVFENNTIDIRAIQAGIVFGDHPQFLDRVQNNRIKVTAQDRSALGIKGNTGKLLVISGNHIECRGQQSLGVFFYSNSVSGVEVVGNEILNCGNGVKFEARDSNFGPSGIRVKNNYIVNCQDGVRFERLGGINALEDNKLSGCAGLPWLVMDSQKGSVTYFSAGNVNGGNDNLPFFDHSVKRLPKGVKPPE